MVGELFLFLARLGLGLPSRGWCGWGLSGSSGGGPGDSVIAAASGPPALRKSGLSCLLGALRLGEVSGDFLGPSGGNSSEDASEVAGMCSTLWMGDRRPPVFEGIWTSFERGVEDA